MLSPMRSLVTRLRGLLRRLVRGVIRRVDPRPAIEARLQDALDRALERRQRERTRVPTPVRVHAHLQENLIVANNVDMLYLAMQWQRRAEVDPGPLKYCVDLMDVNGRVLLDQEVIAGACANRGGPGRTIVEIGTSLGVGTDLMAEHAPEADIITINVPPDEADQAGRQITDAPSLDEIGCYYRANGRTNITQLLVNTLHWNPDMPRIDIAYIDGCHDVEYVYQDTVKVLSRCQPGSLIVWHDFSPRYKHTYGWVWEVCEAVERLYEDGHLSGRLVHLRDSWSGLYVV